MELLAQKHSIPVFINDWSQVEQLQFHHGLNYLFINNLTFSEYYNVMSVFVNTRTPEEITMFSTGYFFSEFHNQASWTQMEHFTFMTGYELFKNNFVEIKKYLPNRSLVDVHEYATRVLPDFMTQMDLSCYENLLQGRESNILPTLIGSMECVYVPPVISEMESTKLTDDFNRAACKHSLMDSFFDLDIEPIALSDVASEEDVMDDSDIEFLFENLFC